MESLCIRIPKKAAEEARRKLIELDAIDKSLKIRSEDDYLLIPITRPVQGYDIEKRDFEVLEKEKSPAEILGFAPAYEQIGDIAIIDRHEPEAQRIAEVLIRQKKIKTVLQAETSVGGEYRTRGLSVLAGERKTETLYKENECRYKLDIARVYFTPRLATERLRVANQIHDGEKVVDMFAGVGPFSILIAKKFPSAHVIAIDKNPDAIHYLRENVKLNKVRNVEIREGDARDEIKGISGVDHVIMNLPHSSLEFLDAALGIVKKGGIIHFYAIAHEDDLFDGVLKKIEETASHHGMRIVPLNKRIVRPYAPYQYNICIDFQVF
ncbi:putative methyltransferase [Candidatus Methanoperedens nitroreducens]|uniref:Putative methyltransferase n=1 Tax=Candidatus Methanoperedens nitratireducens TaxID=1392998 RepID=A0A062V3C4_9EURY|nr:class I SAM-dependent methyltransferase family protein [Candidatus Methanoperedens nitroreducens]KCZ70324.1 putative methyltransferase [Candidatus Methanoperedens nitroreducens]MDJ1421362.1 class I SAM-dependent methyltransferase family protein [Candidatus Methanoperedens sp.]